MSLIATDIKKENKTCINGVLKSCTQIVKYDLIIDFFVSCELTLMRYIDKFEMLFQNILELFPKIVLKSCQFL